MKKLLISILLVLSCSVQAFAFSGVLAGIMGAGSSGGGGEGGSGQWYYAGDGNYETAYNNGGQGYPMGATFSNLSGKTATKISFYIDSAVTSSEFKIAMYTADGTSLLASGSMTSPAAGWNDVTISNTSISGNVVVLFQGNGAWSTRKDTNSGNGIMVYGAAYSGFPQSTQSFSSVPNEIFAVRVYVQ